MKMITAIINNNDSDAVCSGLRDGGFYFTKMSTTGGFLRSGNTTLLMGTEDGYYPCQQPQTDGRGSAAHDAQWHGSGDGPAHVLSSGRRRHGLCYRR